MELKGASSADKELGARQGNPFNGIERQFDPEFGFLIIV
jgi:hypothetical protein